MFINAIRHGDEWRLSNPWGHELRLPGLPAQSTLMVEIGTLGTKFKARINRRTGNRSAVMAKMLKSLNRPIFVVDTRRDGCGGQGSWSPLEFATLIPREFGNGQPYGFLHLPIVAPSHALLATERRGELAGWSQFRKHYNDEVGAAAVAVARAFVEAAAVRGGLAVLLCAEPYETTFDDLPEDVAVQNDCHCHRFNLARRVADAMLAERPGLKVERVDLDAAAFVAAFRDDRVYEPRRRRL